MLRTIHLTGPLARFSKKPVQIEAATTLMVMQGLFNMFGPRFKQIIRDGEWHLTRGKKLKDVKSYDDTIAEEELKFNLGATETIYLCAAVKAMSAVARVVVGIVLIVVGAILVYTGIGGPLGSYLIKGGLMLVLGGVSEMLAPKPKTGQQDQAGQNASFLFNGTVNVTEQGGPVPVIYGRMRRASSLVLSAGMTTENLTIKREGGVLQRWKDGITNTEGGDVDAE